MATIVSGNVRSKKMCNYCNFEKKFKCACDDIMGDFSEICKLFSSRAR